MNDKLKARPKLLQVPCKVCPYRKKVMDEIREDGELIEIPFMPEFKAALLEGRKTATSRSKRYGKPGAIFLIYGGTFLLQAVEKANLAYVKNFLFREEGLGSPDAFVEVWNRIHRRKRYAPETEVFVHYFSRVG